MGCQADTMPEKHPSAGLQSGAEMFSDVLPPLYTLSFTGVKHKIWYFY
jgi:hypothetical protein